MNKKKEIRYFLKIWNGNYIKANEPSGTVYNSEILLADEYKSLAKARKAAKAYNNIKIVKLTLEEML